MFGFALVLSGCLVGALGISLTQTRARTQWPSFNGHKGKPEGKTDLTTAPHTQSDLPRWNFMESGRWDFSDGEITQNNLGGFGPDSGEELMLIEHFGRLDETILDMRITSPNYREALNDNNRIRGEMAQISLAVGPETSFMFQIINHTSGQPQSMERISFTFWDMNHGTDDVPETLTIGNITRFKLAASSALVGRRTTADGFIKFSATGTGGAPDIPDDPWTATAVDQSNGLTAVFQDRHTFFVNFTMGDGFGQPIQVRNLCMSGDSAILLEPTPVPTTALTEAPTPVPSPLPTPLPTPVPTPLFSFPPSPLPTPADTPAPTPLADTPAPTPVASRAPVPTPVTTTSTTTTIALPCQDYTAISIDNLVANNLGNQGPQADDAPEMRFTRVATIPDNDGVGKEFVDVVVTAMGGSGLGYDSSSTTQNGVENGLATINVGGGRGVFLKFTFRRTDDDSIVRMGRFFFTLLDLDKPSASFETIEILQASFPYESFFTDPDTKVMTDKQVGHLTLRGSHEDGPGGNPTDPANLSPDQRKDAVVFWVSEPTSSFQMKFSTDKAENKGRNIMFAFEPTAVGCPAADNA